MTLRENTRGKRVRMRLDIGLKCIGWEEISEGIRICGDRKMGRAAAAAAREGSDA
jgi:hypothetical protein